MKLINFDLTIKLLNCTAECCIVLNRYETDNFPLVYLDKKRFLTLNMAQKYISMSKLQFDHSGIK